jgi:hypothetical protein
VDRACEKATGDFAGVVVDGLYALLTGRALIEAEVTSASEQIVVDLLPCVLGRLPGTLELRPTTMELLLE